MTPKKLRPDFIYLKKMYDDKYFPEFLVNKVRDTIKELVTYIEQGHTKDEIQDELDNMTAKINDLQEEFENNNSEIETVARESIAATVEEILIYFDVYIDIEEALRDRDW
jgi:hypothetical protein